jgi:hypothetical protein
MEENEELERVCFNCNNFFPASVDDITEFGICLNDENFEPFIDELIEKYNYACCQALVDEKKFKGDCEACPEYSQAEIGRSIEIDETTEFGKELISAIKTGTLDKKTLEDLIVRERIRNIDLKTLPADRYAEQLKSSSPKEKNAAISSLGALISAGNKEAFDILCEYFKALPPPKTIKEVHFKVDLLRELERPSFRPLLIPILISELYDTPSNNTTRQWISAILGVLKDSPYEEVRTHLLTMLKDKRFSYRLKKKMKDILSRGAGMF